MFLFANASTEWLHQLQDFPLQFFYLVSILQFRERHTTASRPLPIGHWRLTVQAWASRFATVYLDGVAGTTQVWVDPVITWGEWQVWEELKFWEEKWLKQWLKRSQVLAALVSFPFKMHFKHHKLLLSMGLMFLDNSLLISPVTMDLWLSWCSWEMSRMAIKSLVVPFDLLLFLLCSLTPT